MDQSLIQSLAKFCADQHVAFDRSAWLAAQSGSARGNALTLAAIAKYLSMTSWYGHAEQLEEIAIELHQPLASRDEFERVARDCDFDTSRFSLALRYRLAMRQAERVLPDYARIPCAEFSPASGPPAADSETSDRA